MVALHNRKLTAHDLFFGVLWTDRDWHRKRDEIRDSLEASGLSGAELYFATDKAMMEYQNAQPSMKERKAVLKSIYKAQPHSGDKFTDEEREYMLEKLFGVNDPTGQSILEKLTR